MAFRFDPIRDTVIIPSMNTMTVDPMIAKKRGIMVKWIDWLEEQVQQAIQEDQSLLDPEHIGRAIFRARYGDERYERRLARVEQRGIELSTIRSPEGRR